MFGVGLSIFNVGCRGFDLGFGKCDFRFCFFCFWNSSFLGGAGDREMKIDVHP